MSIDERGLKLFFQKDERTVSCFYHAYYKLLYLVSFDILKNKEESEEVVQETFLKALERGKEDGIAPKAFVSYLCKISTNLSLSRLRKENPCLALDENLTGVEEEKTDNGLLFKLKSFLNENEYKVVSYHLYAELGFKEIGSILGITASAARGLYHRALNKAKANLKKEEWL